MFQQEESFRLKIFDSTFDFRTQTANSQSQVTKTIRMSSSPATSKSTATTKSTSTASTSKPYSRSPSKTKTMFHSVEFEVFGKVQGVFFRKYTHQKATSLALVGYCLNTPNGTVQGVAQGSLPKLNVFKQWLQTEGSPKSRIERCEFSNQRTIGQLEFDKFVVRK